MLRLPISWDEPPRRSGADRFSVLFLLGAPCKEVMLFAHRCEARLLSF